MSTTEIILLVGWAIAAIPATTAAIVWTRRDEIYRDDRMGSALAAVGAAALSIFWPFVLPLAAVWGIANAIAKRISDPVDPAVLQARIRELEAELGIGDR